MRLPSSPFAVFSAKGFGDLCRYKIDKANSNQGFLMQINFQTNNSFVAIVLMLALLPLTVIGLIIAALVIFAKPAAIAVINTLMLMTIPLAEAGQWMAWRVLPDPSTLDAAGEADAA
jgi:hypothetical protein